MRITHITAVVAVIAGTAAKPYVYRHHHAHKGAKRIVEADNAVYAPVAIETIVKYVLDGHDISAEEVRMGIANGTLEWGSDGVLSTSSKTLVALSTPAPKPSASALPTQRPASSAQPVQEKAQKSEERPHKPIEQPVPKPAAKPVEQPSEQPSYEAPPKTNSEPKPSTKADPTLKTAADMVDKNGYCASCDIEFPSGTIPCTQFPYGYGAMPITHEGLGGWSGIQDPVHDGSDGYGDITTVAKGSCENGSCCTPGSFCSYGCPNPYLKLSFPYKQGNTGQSVGGLYCNEQGMLEMADGSLGKTLCGLGSENMIVKVHNTLQDPVSFCRTDYPGTESMAIPLTVKAGETGILANPDQQKYYFWNGLPTSAHYYVNNAGVPESEACTWANEGENRGNWSPVIIGTSYDGKVNEGFTGLVQNELSKGARLNYSITFSGDGTKLPCKYKSDTDEYCAGDECWKRADNPTKGCTSCTEKGNTLLITLS